MILKEYNLSVRLPQEKAIDTGITLVQNDKDVYKLNVRIFDGVNEIDYTDVDEATITFLKSDKNVVQGDMTVEADQLSYTLGTNEIACPGKVLVGIQLFGTTERLSTARFVMSVERDLVTAEAVQSTSEFAILQQLKQDLEAIDVVELTNEFNAHKAETANKHIAESGSNKNGSYIKFDDGTMICTKIIDLTVDAEQTWGAFYITSTTSRPSLGAPAKPFISTPVIYASLTSSSADGILGAIRGVTSNSLGRILIVRGTPGTDSGYSAHVTAIGRWK